MRSERDMLIPVIGHGADDRPFFVPDEWITLKWKRLGKGACSRLHELRPSVANPCSWVSAGIEDGVR